MPRDTTSKASPSTATIGFEAKLWLTADTATRSSANPDCEATWRDLRGAKDHRGDISIYGQESNAITRRLAVCIAESLR